MTNKIPRLHYRRELQDIAVCGAKRGTSDLGRVFEAPDACPKCLAWIRSDAIKRGTRVVFERPVPTPSAPPPSAPPPSASTQHPTLTDDDLREAAKGMIEDGYGAGDGDVDVSPTPHNVERVEGGAWVTVRVFVAVYDTPRLSSPSRSEP